MNRLFFGGGDKEVTFFVEDSVILKVLGTETVNSSFFLLVFVKLFGVDTVLIVDGTIPFNNTNKLGTVFDEELRSPVSDITVTL